MRFRLGLLRRLVRETIDMSDVSGEQMAGPRMKDAPAKRAGRAVDITRAKGAVLKRMMEVLTEDELDDLAGGDNPAGKSIAGRHPRTRPETLRFLAGDDDSWLRSLVARNSSTPFDVLDALSRDERLIVRLGVKKNPRYGEFLDWQDEHGSAT